MVCTKCNIDKPLEAFHRSVNTPTGRHSICATCRVTYVTKDRQAFPEAVRAYQRRRGLAIRARIIALLGGKCTRCSFTDIRALQIDHIHGGGVKAIADGGLRYYSRVLKFLRANPIQDVYQCLCANCNWIKRAENGETRRRVA